jgi:hypothetical protein
MTLASRVLSKVAGAIRRTGQSATLVVPTTATSSAGVVTESSSTSYAVTVTGPVEEAKRYAAASTDTRVTATFYLPAQGLAVTPTQGCRLTVGSVTWQVIAVGTDTVQATVTSYRLDCGQVVVDG